jgi:hypothetical protein
VNKYGSPIERTLAWNKRESIRRYFVALITDPNYMNLWKAEEKKKGVRATKVFLTEI